MLRSRTPGSKRRPCPASTSGAATLPPPSLAADVPPCHTYTVSQLVSVFKSIMVKIIDGEIVPGEQLRLLLSPQLNASECLVWLITPLLSALLFATLHLRR